MASAFPKASFSESAYFNSVQVVPNLLQGLFTRRRRLVGAFARADLDGRVVRFCHRLQEKYASPAVWLRVFADQGLLLFDRAAIRHVLEGSPSVYGPPSIKVKGMGHFQPGALTLSRGEEWKDRRRFNEAVLDSGAAAHRLGGRFLEIARAEVEATRVEVGEELAWPAFADLFARLTRQVVFGRGARDDKELTDHLAALMRRGNTAFLPHARKHFDALYERIGRHLREPEEGSLMALAAAAESTAATRVANQVPHWMFAMKDTLAANAARTLAVIGSHPEVEESVRAELAGADLGSAAGVAGLAYLEGCVHEAMRLWPTTPLLSRNVERDDEILGVPVAKGTQILILNTFNHRNRATVESADAFVPERWRGGEPDYQFNHFSNGAQVCAGLDLALFLGRAVLAGLIERDRWRLERPRLDPGAPLPYMVDYNVLRWRRTSS
jgi:cytochrome P450